MCAAIAGLVAEARELLAADPLVQLRGLQTLTFRAHVGQKNNWRGPGVDHARSRMAAGAGRDTRPPHPAPARGDQPVHHAGRSTCVDPGADPLRRAASFPFMICLVLSRRLLPFRRTGAADLLHQRYSRILLDEFQDTDPIQIELAVLLAHPGPIEPTVRGRSWPLSSHRGVWSSSVTPSRPSTVSGEPTSACTAETERVLDVEPTKLITNFRSVPGIVAWVNEMFGREMGDGEPDVQPAYTALAPARPAHRRDPEIPVTVLGGPHDSAFGVGLIREREAADVAAVVCRAMEEEWPVHVQTRVDRMANDRSVEGLPGGRRSFATLPCSSRLGCRFRPLNRRSPPPMCRFVPETNSLVYATQEVRDLVCRHPSRRRSDKLDRRRGRAAVESVRRDRPGPVGLEVGRAGLGLPDPLARRTGRLLRWP